LKSKYSRGKTGGNFRFLRTVGGYASAVLRKKSLRKSFAKGALDTGSGLLYDGIKPLRRKKRTVSKPKGEL
jgi:hypothetical protein